MGAVGMLNATLPISSGECAMKILVVDDDGATLNALKAGISSLGHAVEVASDPLQALDRLDRLAEKAAPVELLISDLCMPGQSGLELISQAQGRHPRLRAILMTAYGGEDTRRMALAGGCGAYMEKPFTIEELRRVISLFDPGPAPTPPQGGDHMRDREERAERASAKDKIQSADGGKFLTFTLAGEDFGVGILKVKEIIGIMEVTPIPRTPEFIKGVINLRGRIIPVIDLRLKFGMPEKDVDERTCIVVMEVATSRGLTPMGLVVDEVNEVANIKTDQIENSPSFGVAVETQFILGMAKMGDGVKILLDIDRVLSEEETVLLSQAA